MAQPCECLPQFFPLGQAIPLGQGCKCIADGAPTGTPSQLSTDPVVKLTGEIVNALCGLTLTGSQLLARLQTKFPDSGWTLELLNNLLARGKKKGIFCVPIANAGFWAVNLNMVLANPSNSIYQDDCSKIVRKKQCSVTIASHHTAIYSGGISCNSLIT